MEREKKTHLLVNEKKTPFKRSTLYRLAALALAGVIALGACSPAPAGPAPTAAPPTAAAPSVTPFTPTEATASPTLGATPTAAPAAETPTTPSPASATQLPDPAQFEWRTVVTGLKSPIGIANAGDGSGRLFVIEKAGTIRIVQDGNLLPAPFLDLRDRVGSGGSEQGLLGLAFHPQYAQNGQFYVNYTDDNGNTVIARFKVGSDPNQADPNSEAVLLRVEQPFANHNGGGMAFGPDGFLYLSLGDGGSAGDPHGNGQSVQTLLGKLLRIDVDQGDPYAIPEGNPFAQGGGLPEIWAYGLRNPWRFTFDSLTGDLYIADVGQNTWEEIDFLPAGAPDGANFGWSYREGSHPFKGTVPADTTLIDPVFEYSHQEGGCSVTGGVVYRGGVLPDWQGVYLFGDFCSGKVWGLLHSADGGWQGQLLFETGLNITSFGAGEDGEVYLSDYRGNLVVLAAK